MEQAHWGYKDLQGLRLPLERKAIQPMALALEGGNSQAMQQFIGQGGWQDEPVLGQHRQRVGQTLGEADGVFIIDGLGFPKKGEHSVGVARQWYGVLGKGENCQGGVWTAYAGWRGYTLVGRRLYLPEEWFDQAHAERWQKGDIPEETPFQTKPELGLTMLQAIIAEGHLPGQWVAVDEAFGRATAFLDGVAARNRWYRAEGPVDTEGGSRRPQTEAPAGSGQGRPPTRVRLKAGEPTPQRMEVWANTIPADEWRPYLIKEGSQGPIVAEFAFRRVVAVHDGLPGPDGWLVLRRALGSDPELKFYLSNAPAETAETELVRVVGLRWPVETAIEECKGGLGMDHYEVRTWLGWHHHMTLCLLAHHFLVRTQRRLKKRARTHFLAGSDVDCLRFAAQAVDARRSLAAYSVYSAAKSCGLSVAS